MSDTVVNGTEFILRDIQRTLADMRDEGTVSSAILFRLENNDISFLQELRALRNQFDRFRNDTRQSLTAVEGRLDRIEVLLTAIARELDITRGIE